MGSLAISWALLACLAAPSALAQARAAAPEPSAAPAPAPEVAVRLVLDLECPHSRKAWPLYREATRAAAATLLVHHLPVSRHPRAQAAALAALAARAQGKENSYIDALLQSDDLTDAALLTAAEQASLDLVRFAKDRGDPRQLAALERERQAALAFGVQATPSALIAGRGLGGVPSAEAVRRHLAQARRHLAAQAKALPLGADTERAAMAQARGEFLSAFDQLCDARAGEGPATRPAGALGALYRVEIEPGEASLGPPRAALTAVAYVDPSQAWTLRQLDALRRWQAQSADNRLIVRVLPAPQGEPQRLALLWTALALAAPQQLGAALASLPAERAWRQDDLAAAASAAGLAPEKLIAQVDRPEATAALHRVAAAARHIDASSGAVYINGFRWLGSIGDAGWTAALQQARTKWLAAGPAGEAYRSLVRGGRWRQDAELDLQEPLELGDLSPLASLGNGSTEILVLMDFSSPASRAAWHMLRRWIAPGPLASRLRIAALPDRNAGPADLNHALLAAAALDRTAAAVAALLDQPTAALRAPGAAQAPWLAKALRIAPDQWRAALQRVAVAKVRDHLRALRTQTDWGDEPVIFLAGRLYTGPLDEARLDRALRFAASSASARATGQRLAQEAP